MKIYVVPRKFFLDLKGKPEEKDIFANNTIISINTPKYKKQFPEEEPPFSTRFQKLSNVLILKFHDSDQAGEDVVLMNENDADKLVEFISHIDKTKPIIVHCTAGKSRSQAVGCVLNLYFNKLKYQNQDDYEWYERENKYKRTMNCHVKSLFLEKILKFL